MNKNLKAAFVAVCSIGFVAVGTAADAKPRHHHNNEQAITLSHAAHKRKQGHHARKRHGHGGAHAGSATEQAADQPLPPPSATPNNAPMPDPAIAAYYENLNLPPAYTPKAFQRVLQMAGFDIGPVDGAYGKKTIDAVRGMLKLYPGKFQPVFSGDPDKLTPQELSNLTPAMYRRIAEIGILGVQAEPQRMVMMVRATGSHKIRDGRTMVEGEFIMRTWDGREAFVVERGKNYAIELMKPAQADARIRAGEKIYRPQFNSGALNYGRGGKAYQDAKAPWNPYPGSALPGLSGGITYGLHIDDTLLNIHRSLSKSFGDLANNRSWIRIDVLDPEVAGRRDGFGIHVDGATVGKEPGDGTAGCLGVREPYARVFFEFIKQMPENERPSHLIVVPPSDPALSVQRKVEGFFKEFFSLPKRAVQQFDDLLKEPKLLFKPKP